MTDSTPDGAVAWQYEFFEFGEGWIQGLSNAHPETFRVLPNTTPMKWRNPKALIPAASLDALRNDLGRYMMAWNTTSAKLQSAESKLAAVGALADDLQKRATQHRASQEACREPVNSEWHAGMSEGIQDCVEELRTLIAETGTGEGGSNG